MTISTRAAYILSAATLILSGSVMAQQSVDIDPGVFRIYLESRTQQPASQATQEQTEAVRSELTDIYLLSDTARAAELKDDADMKARVELQTRAMLAQAVAADYLTNNPATEEEMRAMYDEQVPKSSRNLMTVLILRNSQKKNRPALRALRVVIWAGSRLTAWSLNSLRRFKASMTAPTRTRRYKLSLDGT